MIKNFGMRFGNVDELPPSLQEKVKAKLRGNLTEKGQLIINALNENLEGVGTINEILIAVYNLYKIELTRLALTRALFYLVKNGHLFYVKDMRGCYTTQLKLVNVFCEKTDELL